MAKKKRLECQSCQEPIRSQESPLDFAAAKRGLCPHCYIQTVESTMILNHIERIRACEHLWSDWSFVSSPECGDEFLFHRSCCLCNLNRTAIGPVPPPEPESLDISWCDLNRTVPEP